jgi:hypothetical protein
VPYPRSSPIVSCCREIFLPCFIASVLPFFIAGLFLSLCFKHVDNLGAYSIPSGDRPGRAYSFLTIFWQSSQRLSLNCCPGSGTAWQMRQTHPFSRHRSAHTRSLSRSVSPVTVGLGNAGLKTAWIEECPLERALTFPVEPNNFTP